MGVSHHTHYGHVNVTAHYDCCLLAPLKKYSHLQCVLTYIANYQSIVISNSYLLLDDDKTITVISR